MIAVWTVGVFLFYTASVQAQGNITVQWTGGNACVLSFRGVEFSCTLGRNGVTDAKIEGDGCTPSGVFPLREVQLISSFRRG